MAKKGQDPRALEDLTIEELREKIEEDKKNAKRSTAFAAAALIAIIALCIAWFIANNLVTGTSSQIAAKQNASFELASVGVRQEPERKDLGLQAGTQKTLNSYVDLPSGETVTTGDRVYYAGENGLAWYLNKQEKLQPGARGKLEFYVIPKHDGLRSVTIKYAIDAYKVSGNKATKMENDTLQNLVDGHVVLFQNLNDATGYYSGWIKNGELTINAPDNGVFVKDTAYKVTAYWVWPKYFRNYIYESSDLYGDLCKTDSSADSDHTNLLKFVEDNKGKLFADSSLTGDISTSMSDSVYEAYSDSYDLADEFIGKNAQYLYIQATVK